MRSARTILTILALAAIGFVLGRVDADTVITYSLVDSGGVSFATSGGASAALVGYARIQPEAGNTTPAGLAIFGFRQGGVLVSEAGVPASPLIRSGRIYAEVRGAVNTGIAIANPNSAPAVVDFYFTDAAGVDFGHRSVTISAGGQTASFLNQPPFNGGPTLSGTFTFNSSLAVSVIALRGFTNERSEFLITTLPVTDISATASGSVIFPHFADGGGWATQVVLVNPTDNPIGGTVQFLSTGTSSAPGIPTTLTANGQPGSSFSYSIPRRSSFRLETSGTLGVTSSGSVRITPAATNASPSGLGIFSFRTGGVTVSEAGVPAQRASSASRLYAEVSLPADGNIQTGVAVANPSSSAINVQFQLTALTGAHSGFTGAITIGPNGQSARFLSDIPGLQLWPRPFKGVLRVSTTATTGVVITGLRSRINERGDFLITTTPPVDEAAAPSSAEALFPHLVDGGGYTTQFILFSGSTGQASSGAIRSVTQSGQPLDLQFGALTDLAVTVTDSPDPVRVSDTLTYSITASNNGPSMATGVTISSLLPQGTTFVSSTTPQGSCAGLVGNSIRCDVGNIAAQASVVVTIRVRPAAPGTVTNTVFVSSNVDEAQYANNQNTVTTVAAVQAELGITQTGPPSCNIATTCNTLSITMTITNSGPGAASGVIVTDTLPVDPTTGSVAAALVSATPTAGSCSAVTNGQFSCQLGSIPSGATRQISIVLDIDSTVIGRVVTNRVTVQAGTFDTNAANNTSALNFNVTPTQPETDLEILALTASPNPVSRGSNLTVTGIVINNGRSTATQVVVTTTFSGVGSITLVSASSTQGACAGQGNTVSCNLGTFQRDSAKIITIVVRLANTGTLVSSMSIAGNPEERDPNSAHNSESFFTTVN